MDEYEDTEEIEDLLYVLGQVAKIVLIMGGFIAFVCLVLPK